MSKLTALFTVLVLGSSASAALAAPGRPTVAAAYDRQRGFDRARNTRRPERQIQQPIQRFEDRFDQGRAPAPRRYGPGDGADFGPRRYRPTWVALSAPQQLARTGWDSIAVNDGGTFTQLRLQSAGGVARIDRVVVQFADGSSQVADLDRVLDDRDDLLEIQLDGNNRRIDRIVVTGACEARGAFQVFGI